MRRSIYGYSSHNFIIHAHDHSVLQLHTGKARESRGKRYLSHQVRTSISEVLASVIENRSPKQVR